jgi:hypothetical protein
VKGLVIFVPCVVNKFNYGSFSIMLYSFSELYIDTSILKLAVLGTPPIALIDAVAA